MLKSKLIPILAKKTGLPQIAVQEGLKELIEFMADILSQEGVIEIRGFGRFSVRHHRLRQAKNPKTGEKIVLDVHRVPRFKPSKFLIKCLNDE